MTHEELEKFVNYLLIINAYDRFNPLSKEACAFIDSIKLRVGDKGYRIVNEIIEMQGARAKYQELQQQLKILEEDFPKLIEEKKK
jgi:hypothetical protein